jgi:Rieske Fe-S protein
MSLALAGRMWLVFRDEDGRANGIPLRCAHLCCLLHFGAERTWDCPRHGSPFGIDGEVLASPATHSLPRHDAT